MLSLSIVVPAYNEEANIPLLIDEVHQALAGHSIDYELVIVDDGSRDNTFAVLQERARADKRLSVIQLRRNFGQSAAMQAGIDAAQGNVIVLMDADLQNDPHDIPRMLAKLDEGYDLVAGWRKDRKDTFINRRLPSMIANWIISRAVKVPLHDYGCTLKALRREVAKELKLYGEMHRFIPALASLVGARVYEMAVGHRARRFGTSKYGIGRTLRVVLDLITVLFLKTYLVRPMQVFGFFGLGLLIVGLGISGTLTVQRLLYNVQLSDRPLLLLGVMLILMGVQILSLGLVADVVGRTYHEAQGKVPYYVRTWTVNGEERVLESWETRLSLSNPQPRPPAGVTTESRSS
jgi:glycosyltransferase involved in cell wall biosynthesis